MHKSGKPLVVEVRTAPVRYRGAMHAITVTRDITERQAAEKERSQLEGQVRQAQKMEAIGHVAGGIAHDFNNILTAILGYVVLASEREEVAGSAKLQGYLDHAAASARRAQDLIAQLLMFARGRRGERSAILLPALIRDAHTFVRSTLPATLELRTTLADVPNVIADAVQLEQVLVNLCINARDALNGSGTVHISVRWVDVVDVVCTSCRKRVAGSFVELAVRDEGPGIAPEVLERIFEPFYTTKAEGKGTGMGLAVVHGIVHEHGGHVVVDTIRGQGTAFRILLPATDAAGAAPGNSQAQGSSLSRSKLRGRVLVVDDEPAVAKFMCELLESWGLETTMSCEPDTALSQIESGTVEYDLVITDYTMPRMNGVRLAEAIARHPGAPPVLLYSGNAEAVELAELSSAGIKGLLRKPLEPRELRSAITPYVERESPR
jgi:signal transduction histidine kinase/CheY-like chemotaxis protein